MRVFAVAMTAALSVSAGALMSTAYAAEASQQPLAEPATTGSCTIKKTEYAASTTLEESASESFVNLSDAGSITFTQKKAGCVSGTFFANSGNAGTGDSVVLQVLLDGAACAPLTSNYFFANSGSDFSSHAAAFFCGTHVSAGTHKIQVQYRSFEGGEVEFFQRSLIVTHT
jgi:hypothetical protein